jgi:hypothetical protein
MGNGIFRDGRSGDAESTVCDRRNSLGEGVMVRCSGPVPPSHSQRSAARDTTRSPAPPHHTAEHQSAKLPYAVIANIEASITPKHNTSHRVCAHIAPARDVATASFSSRCRSGQSASSTCWLQMAATTPRTLNPLQPQIPAGPHRPWSRTLFRLHRRGRYGRPAQFRHAICESQSRGSSFSCPRLILHSTGARQCRRTPLETSSFLRGVGRLVEPLTRLDTTS